MPFLHILFESITIYNSQLCLNIKLKTNALHETTKICDQVTGGHWFRRKTKLIFSSFCIAINSSMIMARSG